MKKIKLLTTLIALPMLGGGLIPLTSCKGGSSPEPTVVQHTVTFTSDEGGTLSGETTIKVDEGTKWSSINKPTVIENDGFVFDAWYKDNQKILSDFDITTDITITAKFIACTPQDKFTWELNYTDFTASLKTYDDSLYDVIIPSKVSEGGRSFVVTSIASAAFKEKNILTVKIPYSLKTIGESAFEGNSNLTSVTFGESLEEIGTNAFINCNIESIVFPTNLKKIGWKAFSNNSNLTNITFNEGLDQISREAFSYTNVSTLTFPKSLSYIAPHAFDKCRSLSSATFLTDNKDWRLLIIDDGLGAKVSTNWDVSDASKNANQFIEEPDFAWITLKTDLKTFEEDSWANICFYAKYGFRPLREVYKIFGTTSFIGLERIIHINNLEHKVRVIGENHDTIAGSTTKAALTFELIPLLSYTDGTKLTCKRSLTGYTNNCYLDSPLRANLTKSGAGSIKWYNSEGVELPENRCVYEMLTDDFKDQIKTVEKQTLKYYSQGTYTVTTYQDKLFPLTHTEMSQGQIEGQSEGTYYSYWYQHNEDGYRIKKDIAENAGKYWLTFGSGVGADGKVGTFYDTAILGVSFAFCI